MFAIKGLYEGGDRVKIDTSELSIDKPYNVIVTFLEPAKNDDLEEEEDLARREAGFQHFMKYQGSLSADFDYKKEKIL